MMSAPSEKRIDFKPFKHMTRMPTGKSGRIGPDSDGPTIFEPNNWKRSGSDWTGAGSTDWMMSAPSEKRIDFKPFKHMVRMQTGQPGRSAQEQEKMIDIEPQEHMARMGTGPPGRSAQEQENIIDFEPQEHMTRMQTGQPGRSAQDSAKEQELFTLSPPKGYLKRWWSWWSEPGKPGRPDIISPDSDDPMVMEWMRSGSDWMLTDDSSVPSEWMKITPDSYMLCRKSTRKCVYPRCKGGSPAFKCPDACKSGEAIVETRKNPNTYLNHFPATDLECPDSQELPDWTKCTC